MRAAGLWSAVIILLAGSGMGLAVGSANAETAAPAELETPETAESELEALETAESGVDEMTPRAQRAERRREQRERQMQRRRERREQRPARWEERFAHVRAVLFDGIELTPEQSRGVDAIIEAELSVGKRSGELDAELQAAREKGDRESLRALRAESRDLRTRRKGPNACMEEMRALLTEEQRPIFDMNRARLAAEGQEVEKKRRRRRPL